ncbi:unnamed protein product [Lactuca virosa]|uniref:Uncharacterized protein n=1 Tax=Lactuca virosa TaxID=75947 RepID=A0AAU9PLI3_9ASTR|nr:unnamed protein product [Lactuca virosa]
MRKMQDRQQQQKLWNQQQARNLEDVKIFHKDMLEMLKRIDQLLDEKAGHGIGTPEEEEGNTTMQQNEQQQSLWNQQQSRALEDLRISHKERDEEKEAEIAKWKKYYCSQEGMEAEKAKWREIYYSALKEKQKVVYEDEEEVSSEVAESELESESTPQLPPPQPPLPLQPPPLPLPSPSLLPSLSSPPPSPLLSPQPLRIENKNEYATLNVRDSKLCGGMLEGTFPFTNRPKRT